MRKKFDTEQIKEIVNARAGGMKWREIIERWEVSAGKVMNWARSLSIDISKKGFKRIVGNTPETTVPEVLGKHISQAVKQLEKENSLDKGLLFDRAKEIAKAEK